MTEEINVYSTFEYRYDDRTMADFFADTFNVLPIKQCINVEITQREIECKINIGEIE